MARTKYTARRSTGGKPPRKVLTLSRSAPPPPASSSSESEGDENENESPTSVQPTSTSEAATLLENQQPHDVKIFFPRTGQTLSTSSAMLIANSPYYKSYFIKKNSPSDLEEVPIVIEPVVIRSDPPQIFEKGKKRARVELEDEDSDLEDGNFDLDENGEGEHDSETKIYEVCVEDHAYKTYKAVLGFMSTGTIVFSNLKSNAKATEEATTTTSEDSKMPEKSLALLTASPKSVYRLARSLEMTNLGKKALTNFRTQLSIDNVAQELFSKTVNDFPELENVALKYVVKNLEEVKETEGFKEVEENCADYPWAAETLFKLVRMIKE